jgi:hypothetical protein
MVVPLSLALRSPFSGGGFRAMLFHTSALMCLYEFGLLSRVTGHDSLVTSADLGRGGRKSKCDAAW